jgi:chromate reductase, NAD(P)H dehydrogenase (quinone)
MSPDYPDSTSILAIAGSLRRGSYNRALIEAARDLAPEGSEVEPFALDDIPLFNEDVEAEGFPAGVQALHDAIGDADALLIATPEYQQGVPGVLKNALDWASRPPGKATITGKPVAIMGATPGLWGTARAQTQLRQTLAYNRCPMVFAPEVLVAGAERRFDDEGRLTHEPSRDFVSELLRNLVTLAARLRVSSGAPVNGGEDD